MTAVALTPEQVELRDVVARFLAKELTPPAERVSTDAAEVPSDNLWRQCAELGWFGLGVPEDLGGAGLGPVEEALLFIEIGRNLARGGYLPTVVAGWLAAANGHLELLAGLVEGRLRAGFATGTHLLDASSASVVVRLDGQSCELREVTGVQSRACVDPATDLGTGELGSRLITTTDPCWASRTVLLVAASQVGMAEATRDMAVDYAKNRVQFSRPIGAFQAVKHRCADMAIRAAAAYAQVIYAAFELDRRSAIAPFHAASAAVVARGAARRNAADNIQNHGAIGYTEEHPAGSYARRAQVLESMLDPEVSYELVLREPRVPFETMREHPASWFSRSQSPGGNDLPVGGDA